jgi:PAS domain S-box-containing protein
MRFVATREVPAAPARREALPVRPAHVLPATMTGIAGPLDAMRLYDFAPAMYVLIDRAGRIVDINQSGSRLIGRGREQAVGHPFRLFVAPPSRSDFLEHLRRCRSGADVVETEVQLRGSDNGLVTVRLYSKQTSLAGRAVFPTVAADLTEYLSLERQKKAAEQQRDRAERERALARASEDAKDRLLAVVSHELRNPLSPALVAAATLAASEELPDRARHLARVIERNIQLEARLIDDLLDVARILRGHFQLHLAPANVHHVLLDAIHACAHAAQARDVAVSIDFRAEHHGVQGDAARLRQVFWNVLDNAIKFSEPGGTVLVRTTTEPSRQVRVTIQDEGAGMDRATLDRLFRPFDRDTDRPSRSSGLGLGLSIAHDIVLGHHGRLWAASDGPGRGAIFVVELPLTRQAPARRYDGAPHALASAARPQPPPEPIIRGSVVVPQEGDHGRVLVIEDHEDMGLLLMMLLSQHGYDVTLATSRAEGLRLLDRPWHAVLSDVGLGDGSGLDIAREARASATPPRRLVAISGYGAPADIAASREAGFDDHLVKPVDLARLLAALREQS